MPAPFIKRRYRHLREVVAPVVEKPAAPVVEKPAAPVAEKLVVEKLTAKEVPAPQKKSLKKAPKKAFRKE
jgi:hypothetical protein